MILRDYQQASIDALLRYLERQHGNPLLVLPTGAGKSVVQAVFIRDLLTQYAGLRILCLTHVKELIEQNCERLFTVWPDADAGIYSASLGSRSLGDSVTFAGIQSVHKKAFDLGRYDLIMVDEAHLIPPKGEGMYRNFLRDSLRINPKLRVIGLTATPYRLGTGYLHKGDDAIFSDVAHEVPIRTLLDAGHLAPLTTAPVKEYLTTRGVKKRGGEFISSSLAAAVDQNAITESAVSQIVDLGESRKKWLCFGISVKHATHIRDCLHAHGISAEVVTGETHKSQREGIIDSFKRGEIRALVNVDVLTTGFDVPYIDLLAILRPTQSPGLYLQIMGRGMRIAEGKSDCLVLDFADNINRHGPVDDVVPPEARTGEGTGEAPIRLCDECGCMMHASAKHCPDCGYVFPPGAPKLTRQASTKSALSEPERIEVTRVVYTRHTKPGKPDSVRVNYYNGLRMVCSEWLCFEHRGQPLTSAVYWWQRRRGGAYPRTVTEALERIDALPKPEAITVRKHGKFFDIETYHSSQFVH